jgi:hypothetical protein
MLKSTGFRNSWRNPKSPEYAPPRGWSEMAIQDIEARHVVLSFRNLVQLEPGLID